MDKLAGEARDRPGRAAAAERAAHRLGPPDRPGAHRERTGARGDRALRRRSRCRRRSRERGRDPLAYPGGAGNVSRGESLRRGVGFAVGFKNIAYSEGFDDAAEATVTLRPRAGRAGRRSCSTAAVDYGQGLYTVLAQIVRTELGVDDVVVRARVDRGRLRRLDVGVAPDDDDGRRRARRLPRGAGRAATRRRPRTSRSRARSRTTTARPTGFDAEGPGRHPRQLRVRRRARRRRGRRRARPRPRRPDRGGAGRRPRRSTRTAPRARSRAAPRRGSGSR